MQVGIAVFVLSHGSYLLNFAVSIWIQLGNILLAHPTIQFSVGNRANSVYREFMVTNVIFIIK